MSIQAKANITNYKYTQAPTRPGDLSTAPLDQTSQYTIIAEQLIAELDQCPLGMPGWKDFENISKKIILFAFEPCFSPFGEIEEQEYCLNNIDRLDYRIPNNTRNDRTSCFGKMLNKFGQVTMWL